MTTRAKVLVAIPAYNCEKQITRVLDEINARLEARVDEIVVIDNRSTDNTLGVLKAYKKSGRLRKLRILQNEQNYSLGGTHKVAFQRAQEQRMTHVVILHGDNQAKSDEINELLDYAETHPLAQTVLGSRFSKGSRLEGYDWRRILGNRVLNAVYSILTFRRCEDLGSGLNLFAIKDLDASTYLLFADKLTFNFELLLDLIKRRVNFAYMPITWREKDQVSNARNFTVAKIAFLNLLAWRFGVLLYPAGRVPKRYISKEIQ